ncbi:DoxX family protein [Bacillus horti]|uniref:Thiosulfate dehydrogenase [quinone] large subunit n=1 Tax=Caldalkalibacillus horti TaxID=77523 RepID=A0ABT9VY71_9BACI|nr:DoxX family protein [Bacillus horti]MDQ0165914.1 thiosulfate dehydrogenase [quinone] large subunit [Bacillus horti]
MIGNFLRTNRWAAVVLTFARIWLGWSWLKSGWGKVTGGFDASGFMANAINNPVAKGDTIVYPNYVAFLENFAAPNIDVFNFIVPWGEVLVGLGLILGCLTTAAAFFGVVMNFAFMFAGTMSTNPMMVLISIFLFVAAANAGRYGLDRWVMPYLREKIKGLRKDGKSLNT